MNFIILDALFVAVFRWGLPGAAAATAASQCVGGIIPLVYFARPNSSILILPLLFGVDGIWFSIVAAEVMAVAITLLFLKVNQKRYQY